MTSTTRRQAKKGAGDERGGREGPQTGQGQPRYNLRSPAERRSHATRSERADFEPPTSSHLLRSRSPLITSPRASLKRPATRARTSSGGGEGHAETDQKSGWQGEGRSLQSLFSPPRSTPRAHQRHLRSDNNATMESLSGEGSFSDLEGDDVMKLAKVFSFQDDSPPSPPEAGQGSASRRPKHPPLDHPPHPSYRPPYAGYPYGQYNYAHVPPSASRHYVTPFDEGARPHYAYPSHGYYHLSYGADSQWSSPPPIQDADDSHDPLPPGKDSPGDDSKTATPQKRNKRSIYRSPPSSVKRYSRSPGLQGSPTTVGIEGNLSMIETPRGSLNEVFSPMGPSFYDFGTATEGAGAKDQSSRPPSPSELELIPIQKHAEQPSPSEFMTFSPFPSQSRLRGVSTSPLRTSAAKTMDSSEEDKKLSPFQSNPSEEKPIRQYMQPSPVARGSETKPQSLWGDSRDSSRVMKVRLGSQASSTQKSLEDINSWMRKSNVETPSSRHSTPLGPSPYSRPPHPMYPPSAGYPPPGRLPHGGSMGPPMPPVAPVPFPTIGSAQKPARPYPPPPSTKSADKTPPRSAGKENQKQSKRIVCKCSKSRCLKLYCDCFAVQKFCEGCACKDCRNLPQYESDRANAMSSIKSKNPNAFKEKVSQRGGPGHNMGCKCKKSRCLKKYCECFGAGVFCCSKCKCDRCANIAGSQELIDKRKQMKDVEGHRHALEVANRMWKERNQPAPLTHSTGKSPSKGVIPTPVPPHAAHGMYPVGYVGQSPYYYAGMNYPVHPYTPGYPGHPPMGYHRHPPTAKNVSTKPPDAHNAQEATPIIHAQTKRTISKVTPLSASEPSDAIPPTAQVARAPLNSSRKRLKLEPKGEPAYNYFGNQVPALPTLTAQRVFTFLHTHDIFTSALVCKLWREIVKDEGLKISVKVKIEE